MAIFPVLFRGAGGLLEKRQRWNGQVMSAGLAVPVAAAGRVRCLLDGVHPAGDVPGPLVVATAGPGGDRR